MEAIAVQNLPSKEGRARIGIMARAIYKPLREKLEKERWGEYIAINVDTGDYVVAANQEEATRLMHVKYPGALPFVIRIGYRAVYHFGGTGLNDGKRP
ncbi:hypothetical protein HUU05_23290 [candidate division KSB1 bacterium]|nr:hypothetical protein [candidate division KSB1 bacterium]